MEYHYQLINQLKELVGPNAILKDEKSNWNANEIVVTVKHTEVRKICEYLKKQKGYLWMMDIAGVHYPAREQTLEAVYQLFNRDQNKRIRLKAPHKEGEKVPSITSVYRGANWFEREAFDMMGIQFEGHPNLERILCHNDFVGHALRKDYPSDYNQVLNTPQTFTFPAEPKSAHEDEDVLTSNRTFLNIGPSHPATHGTLRWYVELEGETILRTKSEIGYLHRCFEKMAETHKYHQVVPYTDRLNYCSAPMNNSGYCQAIERLIGITIPQRAQYIRVILNELSRVIDHLVCIGAVGVDMGALTTFWYAFKVRESVYELFERLCGNRILTSITRIGGVFGDVDEDWIRRCKEVVKEIHETIDEVDSLLTKNIIWQNRMIGTGVISAETAIDYGFTGPCLRASGIEHDLRKSDPYYDYDKFSFEVPTYKEGDNFSRYKVRIDEMRQSARILEQALAKLPSGPTQVSDPTIVLPPKEAVYNNIEALMNHFMLVIKGIQPAKGDCYSFSEVANGELGFYVVSDGKGKPYRLKVRPPCFAIYSSFEEIVRGSLLPDAVATLGLFNVVAGELDR